MRGYRFLKEADRLDSIAVVKNELSNTRFGIIDHNTSRLFFGAAAEKAELIVRQYLLMRICSFGLNNALFYSLGAKGSAVIYPMPKLWQSVVVKHGFSVAKIRCSLLWAGYVGLFWGYGVLYILKQFLIALFEKICRRTPAHGRYAYFLGLTAGNIPQPCRDGRSHDIITWYARWKGKAERLETLCHGVANAKSSSVAGCHVMFSSQAVPPLGNLGSLVSFVTWALGVALLSALDLFRGHWWHALLLKESISAAIVRFEVPEKLARDYMFNNSSWIYRPLWTYEAEKKGSRILFYFYSTNVENFKRPEGYPLQANSWQVVNWPIYLAWDEYQADFLRRAVNPAVNVEVVGPIWFQSTSVEIPELPAGSVAVFDVQPQRSSRYPILAILEKYCGHRTAIQFLLDIHAAIRECKRTMVYKRKRRIGKMLHPEYAALVRSLSEAGGVFIIEPDTSVVRVIEGCFAVISMPFTATALWGRELGKPSIYYDPYGVVQKDDRAAHGIQVLCGVNELRGWLAGLSESSGKVPIRGNA